MTARLVIDRRRRRAAQQRGTDRPPAWRRRTPQFRGEAFAARRADCALYDGIRRPGPLRRGTRAIRSRSRPIATVRSSRCRAGGIVGNGELRSGPKSRGGAR